ncbi:MAG TPA: Hsp20/alpha crystallin family protein [Candidatus Polarisedimenticolaceae bacterium]|nr:Hsp20/alpha crystallin family protein [Candidatus Polarisedimenticolaceae bacterium]
MNLVRWDPFRELVTMSNRLNRTLGDSFSDRAEDAFGAWVPPVDIFEKQDHLVIRAEIPGAKREDLDVRVENGVLTLHGERKREADVEEGNTHRIERSYGSFTRSFTLPTTVDASKIAATYKDGILEVSVPKAETAKPKRVEIRAA